MLHFMKLQPGPFEWIKSGKKTYELRLYDEKRRSISVGDIIEFTNMENNEKLKTEVLGLQKFKNFEELYMNIPKTNLGYSEEEQALPSDMEKYYPICEQEKYSVVAIEIKLI